ncbi:MAG: hypothetical protein WA324_04850 [Bryobacteraceae bacterium]
MRLRTMIAAPAAGFFLLGLVSAAAVADNLIDRAQTFALERQFSARAITLWGDGRYMFYLRPQAYSVDHYGILLTADLNIAPGPVSLSLPFGEVITKQQIAAHKHTVLERLPKFRQFLKSELVDAAAMFPTEPASGRVGLAVTIFHYVWEDTADIPTQIIVQGVKKDLLEAKANPALADHAIEMKETE